MKEEKDYIRIFANSFLLEDDRHSIEYRLIHTAFGYRLNQRIHSGHRMFEYLTDWETISHYSNLYDAIYEIFDRLRLMELNNGLYKELQNTDLPSHIYTRKIEQWVDYAARLEFRFFSIHGNHFKYLPRPSPENKAYYLRVYESLKDQWCIPSATDLWLEELIKKEISSHNEIHFKGKDFSELTLADFLKKYYQDFEDQIDRYLLHLNNVERNTKVNKENRMKIQSNFEHFLLPEIDSLCQNLSN